MTTNITPIEALEKIKEMLLNLQSISPEADNCYYKDECGKNCTPKKENYHQEPCMYEELEKIINVTTQALEPQECSKYHQLIPDNLKRCKNKSQECDVTKCEQYKQNEKGYNDCGYKECANNPNCYFKKWQRVEQLHSQQKTFTVEEIREIIFKFTEENLQPCNNYTNCKNSNNDCRECLLAEFKKAVE